MEIEGVDTQMIANNMEPFTPTHPGRLVKDELECRDIPQRRFAKEIGMSYTTLNEVLNGKRPLTADTALLFEAALGIDAGLLVRMQTSYNLQVARKDTKLLSRINAIRKVAAVL